MNDSTAIRNTLAAAIATILGAGPALAQTQGDVNEEIIVTARKVAERLQDVPLAISVFNAASLQETGARDLFDLAHMTPGFAFEKVNRYGVQGGVSRPVIRGMSNILGEGNASVFVDGILYSDSILSFPMDIVERVEVIKGPQAALFGRATFAGAINFITKKGTNTPENKISLRAAEHGDYEGNFLSRGALVDDKLYYMVHGRYYTFDGMYRNSLDGQRIGDEQSKNFNASLEYNPGGMFSAIVSAGITRDDDGHAAIALQERFANNCFLNVARQYYCGEVIEQDGATLDVAGLQGTEGIDRDSTRISAQLEWDFGAFKIVSSSGLFDTEQRYGYDSTYQGGTAIAPTTVPNAPGYSRTATDPVRTGGVMRLEITDREEWQTELRIQSADDARVRWLGGLYYYENRRDLREEHFLATAPTVFSGESQVENVAAFGSVGFDITDRWDVTAELRFARDTVGNFNTVRTPPLSEAEYDTWSPRVTTGFKITPQSMVYLNVAEGHKPGVINADPRFPESIRLADPESAWTYEIGAKNTFLNGRLTANIAAYFTDWTDQQITSAFTFPTGGTQSFITNAGKSEIKGLEIEVSGRLTDSITAGLTYSYIDAQFKELNDTEAGQLFGNPSVAGKRLFGVPENQGSVFGKYSFALGNLGEGYLRIDASYTSKKYDQIFNLAHTGEQELVNLALGMDGEHWSAQLFVKNLTDDRTPSSVTRYVDQLNLNVPQYVNANPAQNNVPGSTTLERAFFVPLPAKRQFGLSVSYSF